MNKKQMKQILEERVERIGLLEQRLETLSQLLDGYKAREQAIVDSLSQASETAAGRLAQAETEAKQTVAKAQAQADALLSAAREESTRILSKAETAVQQYEQRLASYHADLERSAAEVEATAARYAAFIKETTLDGDSRPRAEAAAVTVSAPPLDLPDPQDDPQLVMQNIYKLQNRDIPAATEPEPVPDEPDLFEEIIADLGPRPAPVEEAAAAPRPVPKPSAAPVPPPVPVPEWQPEPEREWVPEEDLQGAPSVSSLMPDAPPEEEEVSLDSLLDEIIAAGDI